MTHQTKALVVLFASLWLLAAVDDPLEYHLAARDAGGVVPRDHITVARFRSLLRQLPAKYTESAEELAARTIEAQDTLRTEGIEERLLTIMEGMLTLRTLKRERYASMVRAYARARAMGMTHAEALNELQRFLDTVRP